MPEEVSTGSIGIEAGAAVAAPSSEQDVFAADMWERPEVDGDEEASAEPGSPERTPRDAPAFDPTQVNLTRMKPEDVPDEYRPLFEAAQRQFKGLQTTLNERQQEIEQLRNGQQRAGTNGQQQPPQQPQQQPADPLNPYPYLALPDTLTPRERMEVIAGAHQVNSIFDNRLEPYRQYLDAMPQIVGALVELVNRAQAGETQAVSQGKQELVELYGEHSADDPAVQALALKITNPATGEPFTYREAYERIHGITGEQVAALEAKRKNARSAAKRSGAGTPRANVDTPASTHLTKEAAMSRMRAAGWRE